MHCTPKQKQQIKRTIAAAQKVIKICNKRPRNNPCKKADIDEAKTKLANAKKAQARCGTKRSFSAKRIARMHRRSRALLNSV